MKDITGAGFFRSPIAIAAADGGYLVAGYIPVDSAVYTSCLQLMKVDSMGNEVWRRSWPQYGSNMADAMVQETTDGGFVVAGIHNTGHFILKVDANGQTVWLRDLGAPTHQIKQTTDGGFIVIASSSSLPPGWNVIKLDTGGLVTWQKFYRNEDVGTGLYGQSIDQTADGGYFVGGAWIELTQDSGGIWSESFPAVIRLDAQGDTLWSKVLSSAGGGVAYVEEAAGGGYYVNGTIDAYQFVKLKEFGEFDWGMADCIFPSGFTFVETPDTAVVVLGHDFANTVRKITADGVTTLWQSSLGLTGRCVQQTHDGGFILTADDNVNAGYEGSTFYLLKTDSEGDTSATTTTSATAPHAPAMIGAVTCANPFSDVLQVSFSLAVAGNVTVNLFDISGKKITLAENEYRAPGAQTFICSPAVAPGMYLLEINSGQSSVVHRVVRE